MWVEKYLIVNIINLQNVDKPRGIWIIFFVEFRPFLMFVLAI